MNAFKKRLDKARLTNCPRPKHHSWAADAAQGGLVEVRARYFQCPE